MLGVYARELLHKRLQFGPLQAERVLAGSQQVAVEEEIKERWVCLFDLVYAKTLDLPEIIKATCSSHIKVSNDMP